MKIGDHVKWESGGVTHFGQIDAFRDAALALVATRTPRRHLVHVELERLSIDDGSANK